MTVKTLTVSGLNVAAQVLGGTGLTSSTTNGVTTLSVSGTQSQATTFSGGLTISASATDVYATITNAASGGRSWIINATSTSSGEGGGRLLFKDATANPVATRMTIDSAGNVGIGTSSPGALLEVKNGNIYSNAEGYGIIVDAGNLKRVGFMKYEFYEGAFVHGNATSLRFGRVNQASVTGGTFTTEMIIDTSGNVGIGTTTPATTLEIAGTGFAGLQMKRRTDAPEISTGLYFDSVAASGTITLSGTTLTVVTTTGGAWAVGQVISGSSITSTVTITALIPTTGGTGGNGTYTVTNSTSQTISGTAVAATGINPGGNNYTIRASFGGLDFLNSSAVNVGGGGSKVYFSSAGKVGIGTTSPNFGLHIQGADATALMIERTANDITTTNTYTRGLYIRSGPSTSDWGIAGSTYSDATYTNKAWWTSTGKIAFGAGGATPTHLVIDTNGNVGIGTNNPGTLLNIVGGTTVGANYLLALSPATGTTAANGLGRESSIQFAASFSNNWVGTDYVPRYSGAITYGAYGGTAAARSWSMKFATGDDDTPTERMRLFSTGVASSTTLRIGGYVSTYTASNYTAINQEVNRHSIVFATWRDSYPDSTGAKIQAINYTQYTGGSGTNWHLMQQTDLAFFTNPTIGGTDTTVERMRILYNGNVGIGTTDPKATLHANGTFALTTATSGTANSVILASAAYALPDAATCSGRMYWVKNTSASAITMTSAGGTIDGVAAATGISLSQNDCYTVISNGTNWFIL